MTSALPNAESERAKLFDVVLYPHRSLSPAGFWLLMAAVSVVSFGAGAAFFFAGAWPVLGFFGLDVLLIYVAFRLSFRAARLTETVSLTPDELLIKRISPRGRVTSWTFQPYWVRVAIDERAGSDSRLVVSSHGRHVALGDFLLHDERVDLAKALRAALADLQATA